MNANTLQLQDLGQSLWLDNITRELQASDRLTHYSRASTTWQQSWHHALSRWPRFQTIGCIRFMKK